MNELHNYITVLRHVRGTFSRLESELRAARRIAGDDPAVQEELRESPGGQELHRMHLAALAAMARWRQVFDPLPASGSGTDAFSAPELKRKPTRDRHSRER